MEEVHDELYGHHTFRYVVVHNPCVDVPRVGRHALVASKVGHTIPVHELAQARAKVKTGPTGIPHKRNHGMNGSWVHDSRRRGECKRIDVFRGKMTTNLPRGLAVDTMRGGKHHRRSARAVHVRVHELQRT